jgi:hypothetical protein
LDVVSERNLARTSYPPVNDYLPIEHSHDGSLGLIDHPLALVSTFRKRAALRERRADAAGRAGESSLPAQV